MVRCGVVGATGYAGAELARLLVSHPEVAGLSLGSSSSVGEEMERIYPNLGGAFPQTRLVDRASVVEESDVVFSSLPHGHAEEIAALCAAAGKLFIDLSADFRFGEDETAYSAWYGRNYSHPSLHAASVYGLPELNRERIAKARIIGNPGCYPTASTLGLFPALRLGFAAHDGIVIDAKSGVTGAGREPTRSTHYAEVADSLVPYKIGSHRHTPEIAAVLSAMASSPVSAIFTPHLAPMGRGIVATIYFRLAQQVEVERLRQAYADFYAREPFVRVLPEGTVATNRNVRLSNYCDISVHLGSDGRTAIVVSAIDNMVKGAAGQAIQNMNIAMGFDEKAGIAMMPPAF
ncbi:MAG TPA: N-acetyl-gamma-glutamyl-phosphate reductase [Rectinemataceae bacterium]|nr:N-acetyl-gamma-glutamyl-phosphate reductase [Rectinemataceae bacterium]